MYISEAISQSIEAALSSRGHLCPPIPEQVLPPHLQSQMDADFISLKEQNLPFTSIHSEDLLVGEGDLGDQELSEDDGLAPDKPVFMGLFKPALFNKAKAAARTSLQRRPHLLRTLVRGYSRNQWQSRILFLLLSCSLTWYNANGPNQDQPQSLVAVIGSYTPSAWS